MSEFEIFPRFRDFVLLFGTKLDENEVGPPPMRFRRLSATGSTDSGSVNHRYAGFGDVPFGAALSHY